MSHSQFQSRIFILTHAWLNLWDERMTTGRINQIIIIRRRFSSSRSVEIIYSTHSHNNNNFQSMPIEISFTNRNQTLSESYLKDWSRISKPFHSKITRPWGIPQFQRPEAFTSSTWSFTKVKFQANQHQNTRKWLLKR